MSSQSYTFLTENTHIEKVIKGLSGNIWAIRSLEVKDSMDDDANAPQGSGGLRETSIKISLKAPLSDIIEFDEPDKPAQDSDFTPGEGKAPEGEKPGFPEDVDYKVVTVMIPEPVAKEIEDGDKLDLKFCIKPPDLEEGDSPNKAWLKPKIKKVAHQARKAAENEFTDWLKEKHEISQHATKREEYMKECTHPEDRRIYPDRDPETSDLYPDDMVWHCLNCGYAEYEEEIIEGEGDESDKICPGCGEWSLVDLGKRSEESSLHNFRCNNPGCSIKAFVAYPSQLHDIPEDVDRTIDELPERITCPFCEEKSLIVKGTVLKPQNDPMPENRWQPSSEHRYRCTNPECEVEVFDMTPEQLRQETEAQDDN